MTSILEINITTLSSVEENHILLLAEQIRKKVLLKNQFDSFKASKNISIRWDASYKDFGFSYCGISVTAEEVEQLVKYKLNQ